MPRAQKSKNMKSKRVVPYDPPQYNAPVIAHNTFRYRVPSGASGGSSFITLQSLLAACGATCTVTGTTLSVDSDSVRIRSIKLWSPPTPGSTVSVAWLPSIPYIRPTVTSDVCTSDSVPAFVSTSPPKNELFYGWMSLIGNGVPTLSIANIVAPVGSILDISVDYQMFTGAAGTTQTTYAVTSGIAVLGTKYYVSLDGAVHRLQPVDLFTTY